MDESPFKKVPAELRNWMYEPLLQRPHKIWLHVERRGQSYTIPGVHLPPFAQACREIQSETKSPSSSTSTGSHTTSGLSVQSDTQPTSYMPSSYSVVFRQTPSLRSTSTFLMLLALADLQSYDSFGLSLRWRSCDYLSKPSNSTPGYSFTSTATEE